MHWIFGVKFVNLGDSCTVGGDHAMNIIIARVPVLNVSEYFMKGVIMGAQYTLALICSIPLLIIIAVVFNKKDLSSLGTGTIGCEFWYALLIIIAHLSLFVILAWMVKRYKMRKREDLLPNEHFFAERYYSY